jgi:hypothetical protein
VVLSPKTLPAMIKQALAKHNAAPKANSACCRVLVVLFIFYASLGISNFMLYITNIKLNKHHIHHINISALPKKLSQKQPLFTLLWLS